ncbi:hypothetical protein [Olivibacter sp. LS-1]|uniref:hypothetical protein n=1 Tax=Olivibacter sp. LS-1 TaxID=2592345 RepID=UPI00143DB0BF|nr:hypothetical protein [Olivibacter sp. LS-1]
MNTKLLIAILAILILSCEKERSAYISVSYEVTSHSDSSFNVKLQQVNLDLGNVFNEQILSSEGKTKTEFWVFRRAPILVTNSDESEVNIRMVYENTTTDTILPKKFQGYLP